MDSAAALNASKPNIAPVAKIIWELFFFGVSIKSKLSSIPEPLTVINVLPSLIHRVAISLNASFGAQSIIIWQLLIKVFRSKISILFFNFEILSSAFVLLLDEIPYR